MTAALRVISPGLMTTLQDLGRPGYQRLGIPVSGALDPISLRAANLIVGNAAATAALEIAYQGPMLAVEADSVRVALAGASAPVDILDESGAARRVPPLQSVRLLRGQRLRVGALAGGAVAYLAVEGGFAVEPMLGSRSTYARAGIGGFAGPRRCSRRSLAACSASGRRARGADAALPRSCSARALPRRARPAGRLLHRSRHPHFAGATYTVSPATDRMGMRLDGPQLEHAKGFNIVSDGIAPGAIQVPGNGLPIVLLADRQTTGGYPKVAAVISADLPALGRLMPGRQGRLPGRQHRRGGGRTPADGRTDRRPGGKRRARPPRRRRSTKPS